MCYSDGILTGFFLRIFVYKKDTIPPKIKQEIKLGDMLWSVYGQMTRLHSVDSVLKLILVFFCCCAYCLEP